MSQTAESPRDDAPASSPIDIEKAVDQYFQQIFRAARGAGLNDGEAEEITQETFMTLLEKADTFEGRSAVRTFLFGILYNKLREHRRWLSQARRHESLAPDADDVAAERLDQLADRFDDDGLWLHPPQGPEAFVYARETRHLLSDCMDSAPPVQRMAFLLREVEGLSSDEICKILDISRTNLGVMLHRFRNRVRNCLESQGIAAGAAHGARGEGEHP
ncbi:MAG: sigma-70 family RNA polymerase sigma factor [Acidobacteriota bacterium]